MGTPRTFKEVWAEKEAAGYQYGHDALENVQFGFGLAVEEYAALEADALRYRWLRVQQHIDIAACWFLPTTIPAPGTPDEIDAAIDAAKSPLG